MDGKRYRQMLYGIQSGQPLAAGYRRMGGRYRRVADALEAGQSLGEAMTAAGVMPVERILSIVGEQAGKLEESLDTLATIQDAQHAYTRGLLGSFLRAVIVAGIGAGGAWGLMTWLNLDVPLWWRVWVVIAFVTLGLLTVVLSMMAPGWKRWLIRLCARFMLEAGVSFLETRRYLELARLSPGSGDDFAGLLRLSGEDAVFVRDAAAAGTTDDAVARLEERAMERMKGWRNKLSTLMYYCGVVVALATVLAGVFAFALAGFGSLGTN